MRLNSEAIQSAALSAPLVPARRPSQAGAARRATSERMRSAEAAAAAAGAGAVPAAAFKAPAARSARDRTSVFMLDLLLCAPGVNPGTPHRVLTARYAGFAPRP